MSEHWETREWKRETATKSGHSHFIKGNKALWSTGRFNNTLYPAEPSEWIEQWTVADIIDNRYCNHRNYKSFEEALENE